MGAQKFAVTNKLKFHGINSLCTSLKIGIILELEFLVVVLLYISCM